MSEIIDSVDGLIIRAEALLDDWDERPWWRRGGSRAIEMDLISDMHVALLEYWSRPDPKFVVAAKEATIAGLSDEINRKCDELRIAESRADKLEDTAESLRRELAERNRALSAAGKQITLLEQRVARLSDESGQVLDTEAEKPDDPIAQVWKAVAEAHNQLNKNLKEIAALRAENRRLTKALEGKGVGR